jgi:hypothetical protein
LLSDSTGQREREKGDPLFLEEATRRSGEELSLCPVFSGTPVSLEPIMIKRKKTQKGQSGWSGLY